MPVIAPPVSVTLAWAPGGFDRGVTSNARIDTVSAPKPTPATSRDQE